MIPPTQGLRLRSISRWLKENREGFASLPQEERDRIATDLDEQMIEAFDERDEDLISRLTRAGLWGTEAGLQQFNTDRMMLWQEVCGEFLPTSGRDQGN